MCVPSEGGASRDLRSYMSPTPGGRQDPPGVGTVVAVVSFLLRELSLSAVAFLLTLLPLPLGAMLLGCWSLSCCSSPRVPSPPFLPSHDVQYFTHWSIIGYKDWRGREKLLSLSTARVPRVLCTSVYTIKDT